MRFASVGRSYLGLILLWLCWLPLAAAETVIKSPNDVRAYESLTLANQLKVLLISDPTTDKAAAALDVNIGSGSDPENRGGLAHFLEHMLFLGTEKYPDPSEYKAFLSTHGGNHNAYTAFEHTNYFFDVDKDSLEPALDRFAQFFVAPLFTAKYVNNERQVVHSEYQSKLKSDSWRVRSAAKLALNPAHPAAMFNIGSVDTLADREGSDIRAELIAFYQQHYSANLMTLVVLGKEPLPTLKQWVQATFAAVNNRNAEALQIITLPLFEPGQLPARLEVIPLKHNQRLSFDFPLPPVQHYYRQKPISYIANLIGHEGAGSLLSWLKNQGWADSLWAGLADSRVDGAMLTLSISLTTAGLTQIEAITDAVFEYLRLIEQRGVQQWLFDEQKQLAEIGFQFQEPSGALASVRSLATALHDYPAQDVLRGPYAMDSFDADLIQRLLAELRPDNMLLTVTAQGLATDAVEPWFQVPYRLTKLNASDLPDRSTSTAVARFALPEPNPFIPAQLTLKAPAENANPIPIALVQKPGLEFWYQQDDTYKVPRAEFYFSLRSPHANDTPRHAMLTQLYVKLVDDLLGEFAYPAYLAGLEFNLYKHIRGLTVRISGYDEKQAVLLERIVTTLQKPALTSARFGLVKADLLRELGNANRNPPYRQAISEITDLLITPSWNDGQQIAALEPLTLADLERFIPQLLGEVALAALSYGNISQAEAQALVAVLEQRLLATATAVEVAPGRLLKLGQAGNYLRDLTVEHDDSALVLYFQGPDKRYVSRAQFALLAQLLESPFFDALRTEKKLGYVVFASPMPLLEVPGLAFTVQSPSADPAALEQHIEEFLASFGETLAALSEAEFNKHKSALLTQILERDKTLQDRANRYWTEIDRQNDHFDSRAKIAAAVRALSRDDLIRAYRDTLLVGSTKLAVRSVGDKHMALFADKKDVKLLRSVIVDPSAFKQGRDAFSG